MAMEKFHWTAPSGVEIVVPYMDMIPGGIVRKNRKLDPFDFIYTLLELVADDAELEKIDALPMGEQNKFFEAWQEEGVSAGKSSGSSS